MAPESLVKTAMKVKSVVDKNPDITLNDIGKRFNKRSGWVKDMIMLAQLDDSIKEKVDQKQIPLLSAYLLGQFDKEKQLRLIDEALRMNSVDFVKKYNNYTSTSYQTNLTYEELIRAKLIKVEETTEGCVIYRNGSYIHVEVDQDKRVILKQYGRNKTKDVFPYLMQEFPHILIDRI